jgi:hypothetical protein
MRCVHRLAMCAVAAFGAGAALAQDAATGHGPQIYQQRTADGRVVLSDRPVAGAKTERTWQFEAEDRAAAQQRREHARREAEAISERIQRQLEREQQRAEELALERLRLAQVQTQRDAERARYDAQREPTVVWFVPQRARHIGPAFRPHVVPQFPPPRLPRFPRPGPLEPRLKEPHVIPAVAPMRARVAAVD